MIKKALCAYFVHRGRVFTRGTTSVCRLPTHVEAVSYTHLDVYKRQAYAYGDFHRRFIRGKITLIGCPKLDEGDYAEKLTEILAQNDIHSVQVVRMEVPCCGGIEQAVRRALERCGKEIPCRVTVISTEGEVLAEHRC